MGINVQLTLSGEVPKALRSYLHKKGFRIGGYDAACVTYYNTRKPLTDIDEISDEVMKYDGKNLCVHGFTFTQYKGRTIVLGPGINREQYKKFIS